MTRQNAANTEQAAALMTDVSRQVSASNEALGEMVDAMASIRESSAQVTKIIKTIDEIAFQVASAIAAITDSVTQVKGLVDQVSVPAASRRRASTR
jgi:hypothetical protein